MRGEQPKHMVDFDDVPGKQNFDVAPGKISADAH